MTTNAGTIPTNTSSTVSADRWVDFSDIMTGQFFTVTMATTAYVLDRWEFLAFQCVVFVLSVVSFDRLDIYSWIYKGLLKPLSILRPDMRIDNIEAYRFADMIGVVVSGSAAYLIYSGNTTIGWGLTWAMMILGSLAFFGWCAACWMYYMFQKMGIKGFFRHTKIAGTFPGARAPRP